MLPFGGILAVVIVLSWANFKQETLLTGGDNLHPEFDFWINIQRSLFAAWQEYQGVGLLGGMGHAADLLRQIFLWLLSFLVPTTSLRYVYTMLTLFIGGIGAYVLTYYLFHLTHQKEHTAWDTQLAATIAGVFYILNLSTIQAYYFPFETFTAHFAALPWLLWGIINYFQKATFKSFLVLCILFLLSTPQSYVPTLFVVFVLSVLILLPFVIKQSIHHTIIKSSLSRITLFLTALFIINAFWLMPFAVFTLTSSNVNINAKINQVATETIFYQNKELGNIWDVMLLRGFWFNYIDPNLQQVFTYSLKPWRDHLDLLPITILGYSLFGVILLGVIRGIRSKQPLWIGLAVLFFFSVTMLSTNTPPFSYIDALFRKLPLVSQVFRFPFTKFSILASLTYAIFFAFGIQAISRYLHRVPPALFYAFFTVLLIFFTFPAFTGNLFSERQQLEFPIEYRQLFDFFKRQDPNTRIANFPQYTFWSWNYYKWGYAGSGFLWYGIKQPILDRAFDPWSRDNENYYFEISQALYSQDTTHLANVFDKYSANWIVIDRSVTTPFSAKALYFTELEQMLSKMPQVEKIQQFEYILIYRFKPSANPKSFVYGTSELPSVNSYIVGDKDEAYAQFGDYKSVNQNQDILYPFRSLLSNKTQSDLSFKLLEEKTTLKLHTQLPESDTQQIVKLPSYFEGEQFVPVEIKTETSKQALTVKAVFKTPEIFLENKKIFGDPSELVLFRIASIPGELKLNINGVANFKISSKSGTVGTTLLSVNEDNTLVLSDKLQSVLETQEVASTLIQELPLYQPKDISIPPHNKPITMTVRIPKVDDSYSNMSEFPNRDKIRNCDNFRVGKYSSITSVGKDSRSLTFQSKNATNCISYFFPTLSHKLGYAITLDAEHVKGRGFHFWILNEDSKSTTIDTYLAADRKRTISTFVIPPMSTFGTAFSMHLDNISIGDDETINTFHKLSVYPFPYHFLTQIKVEQPNVPEKKTLGDVISSVTHPNESLYIIDLKPETYNLKPTIVLSQSYSPFWKAYRIKKYELGIMNYAAEILPFLFGDELKQHIKVNNWSNGWEINKTTMKQFNNATIVLVFLPQYLQYFGFILLFFFSFCFCISFLFNWIKRRF